MHDLRVGPRCCIARVPRYLAVHHEQEVGLAEQLRAGMPQVERVARGQIDAARMRLRDRDRVALGELREDADCAQVAAQIRRQDQRKLGCRDPPCERVDVPRARLRRRDLGRRQRRRAVLVRIREHLARQREIHGPARLRQRDVERAADDLVDGLPGAQLEIPLGVFARDAALIEVLLAPMNRRRPRCDVAVLRQRRAARHQEQRHVVARGIHQRADRVAGADRDVDHDAGRLARDLVVAVRHRHREILVRHGNEARNRVFAPGGAHEAFDDGREVGARVREHVVDAAPFQRP